MGYGGEWRQLAAQITANQHYLRKIGSSALERQAIVLAVAKRSRVTPFDLLDLDVSRKCRYTMRWRDILITVLHKRLNVPVEELGQLFGKSVKCVYRCMERAAFTDKQVIASLLGANGARAGSFNADRSYQAPDRGGRV